MNDTPEFQHLRNANLARQVEWDKDDKLGYDGCAMKRLFFANEMAGEAGEANNVVKKLVREQLGISGSRATREMLAEELADIIICVDLVAIQYDVDLWNAVVRKFNATSEKVGLRTRMHP